MALSISEANALAERSKRTLERIRAGIKTAQTNTMAVLGRGGHEIIGFVGLGLSSWLAGYYGQDKLQWWGVDIRPVVGLAAQLAGLGALLWGMPAGAYGLSVGRGPIGSWLAERAYVRGAHMALPKDRRADAGAVSIRGLPDRSHPMYGANAEVTFTRSNRI
jgi:hypothetical protein